MFLKKGNLVHNLMNTGNLLQNWLILCASVASKLSVKPIQWVTPLGMPVTQPYFKTKKKDKYLIE